MPDGPWVLSLVERGWSAARICSLDLAKRGMATRHLVKGKLPSDVADIIAAEPGISVRGINKGVFWPAAFGLCAGGLLDGKLRAVLVDNDRSLRRVQGWLRLVPPARRPCIVQALPAPEGYCLRASGVPLTAESWYHALKLRLP